MAYRRKFRGRSKRYRRRGFKRVRRGATTARRALRIARSVQRVQRGDRSNWEVAQGQTFLGTPVFYNWPLNVTEVGDGEGERDGEAIVGSSCHIRLRLFWAGNPEALPAARNVRLLVIRVKNDRTGTTSIADTEIFDWTGLSSNQAHLAMYNRETIADFQIMYDRVLSIDTQRNSEVIRDLKFKYPFKSTYKSSSFASDYIYKNKLVLCAIPCGVIPISTGDGAMSLEFKSNFVFYR